MVHAENNPVVGQLVVF